MNARQRSMDEVAVLSLGLCTPLGLTARATQVEMAAGTVRFVETDVPDDTEEPVRASILPLLEPGATRTERVASMAVTALHECMSSAVSLELERVPLLLALPEPTSGSPVELNILLEALATIAAPVRLDVSDNNLFPMGRAGFFHALAEASRLLKSRQASWVLVGAADSMGDRDSLAHHARTRRSLGPRVRDGSIAGEGAGFFLLGTPMHPGGRGLSILGRITGCALSREPHSFLQQKPNLAHGLTDAFRQLRQHPATGRRRVDHVLSCQTGETFWAKEFNYAYLRNAPLMPEPLTVSLVAEALGDIGAAAGAAQLGYAMHLLKQLEPAARDAAQMLIYGCSDNGHVGACIIKGGT